MTRNKVLLIDGHNLFIRSWSVIPTMNENGEHNGGTLGFLRSLKKLINENFPERVIVCWEGVNSVHRRRKLFEGYKSNRGIPKKANRTYDFNETPQEQLLSLRSQLSRAKDYLKHLPVYQLSVEFTEADDVIALIARDMYPDKHKIIVSNDKDFLQLIKDNVSVYRPATKKVMTTSLLLEETNIHPKNWLLFKVFRGDRSDNIPGIKGIGEKTLLKLFPMLSEDHCYNLEEICSICQTQIETNHNFKNKYQKILDNRELLELNSQLMELTDTSMSLKATVTTQDQLKLQKPKFNAFQLRLMFTKDGAKDQVDNFDYWVRAFMPLNYKALNAAR